MARLQSVDLIPCRPPWWARGGHGQTILGHLLPSPKLDEEGESIHIQLDDSGEKIHSTYFNGRMNKVVYLFHGLGGNSESDYMQRTARIARNLGYHVFLNNHRGCGAGSGLARGTYHSGSSNDLSQVLKYGRDRLPHCQHIAVGFSLSANALLLLAAGVRADTLPDIAIAANAPIHLDRASQLLCRGLNRVYNYRFIRLLNQHVRKNRPEELVRLRGTFDLRTFDDVYTAPLSGFINKEDYYQSCSAKQYLRQIKVPTLILTSQDDPFVSSRDYLEAALSPQIVLRIEKYGGHMGYLDRSKQRRRWLDYALHAYLEAIL